MCYHKQSKATSGELEKHFESVNKYPTYQPRIYENGFDFKPSPIITVEKPKELLPYNWGLVPWWSKTLEDGLKLRLQTLNCISEEMFEKPSFRDAAHENRRGLVGCTGFFEWHWSKPEKPKNKTPFKVFSEIQSIFSIGILYSTWKDKKTGEEIKTYTVLTTKANPKMEWLHNSKRRQPVIISKEYEKDWLNPKLTEKDVLELCKSMPNDFLKYYSIGKEISGNKLTSEEKNTPEIEKPVHYSPDEIDEVETKSRLNKTDKGKPTQGQQSLF